MILTGPEIRRQVEQGTIIIQPFRSEQLNPNSYNYRLGELIRPLSGPPKARTARQQEISADGMRLEPGQTYLSHTAERIGSCHYVTSLIGRSSVGRLGLFLQLSADLGNLGPAHRWTLEMVVVQPLVVYSGMIIGQVTFWRPSGVVELYRGRYADHSAPTHCLDGELNEMKS